MTCLYDRALVDMNIGSLDIFSDMDNLISMYFLYQHIHSYSQYIDSNV